MALPFLLTLPLRARQAYPLILRGMGAGLSGTAIQKALQAAGLGIRRTTLLEMIRVIGGVEAQAAHLRNIRPELRPDPARLPEAVTKLRRRYSFEIEVRGSLLDTGERFTRFVTVSSDSVLSRATLESMAWEMVEDASDRYGMEVDEAVLISGRKAGPIGLL